MSAAAPGLRGLFVGIDAYAGRLALGGCGADARGLAEAFGARLLDARLLLDAQATQRRLLGALETLARETADDEVALFYFAGHASLRYGRLRLCPQDTDPEHVLATAFPFDLAFDVLTGAARRVLVILDACHGGGAGFDLSVLHGQRRASVLVSAAPNELAREMRVEGATQGAFTAALRAALTGPGDSPMTLVGLFERAYEETKRRTQNLQHPLLIGTLAYDLSLRA